MAPAARASPSACGSGCRPCRRHDHGHVGPTRDAMCLIAENNADDRRRGGRLVARGGDGQPSLEAPIVCVVSGGNIKRPGKVRGADRLASALGGKLPLADQPRSSARTFGNIVFKKYLMLKKLTCFFGWRGAIMHGYQFVRLLVVSAGCS